MKRLRLQTAVSLVLNIGLIILALGSVGWFFTAEGVQSGVGNMKAGGVACLYFFTNQSNILAALCSCVVVPFLVKTLVCGKTKIPKWALLLQLVGTTAITVTFVVVLLFLGPIMGYVMVFEGNCLTLHLICPLMAIIVFCFFEPGTCISKKEALLGVLPTFLYGTVYLVNVIFRKTWIDFYHFNINGFWYISCIVMLLVTYLLALALCTIHNGTRKTVAAANA